jgi:hypothetical protein
MPRQIFLYDVKAPTTFLQLLRTSFSTIAQVLLLFILCNMYIKLILLVHLCITKEHQECTD